MINCFDRSEINKYCRQEPSMTSWHSYHKIIVLVEILSFKKFPQVLGMLDCLAICPSIV